MMRALFRLGLAVGVSGLLACTENTPPEPPSAAASPASVMGSPERAPTGGGRSGASLSGPASPRLTVRDTWLELRNCQLLYGRDTESHSLDLELPAPCQFARNEDGSVRVVESENGSVLLVESSRRESSPESGRGPADCDTRLRGVIVTSSGVQLSRDTQKVATCAPAQWDEKMFQILAFQPMAPSEH